MNLLKHIQSTLPLVAIFACSLGASSALNNQAVLRMNTAGLTEDVIIGMINSQPGAYSLGADEVIQLKTSKVPDRVIEAMVKRGAYAPIVANAPTVSEIGVYFRDGQEWTDVKPEVVNWKTGGVLKHAGSLGVVKGDLNGLVYGPGSSTRFKGAADILIYTVEGVGASEYQLVRLHGHAKDREFRIVTGGVMHVSEGTMRDIVPYESKKVAPRTYTLSLDHLMPGEYGFVPPNADIANHASASLGKIYSFRIEE